MPGHAEPATDSTLMKDLKNGMRNFNTHVIVLEISPRATTNKEGVEVRACKVADRTACINLSVPEQDIGNYLQPGDICKITKCFVSNHEGPPTLYIGKGGALTKIMEFSMIFNENLNMSEPATPTTPLSQAPQLIATAASVPPATGGNIQPSPSTTSAV